MNILIRDFGKCKATYVRDFSTTGGGWQLARVQGDAEGVQIKDYLEEWELNDVVHQPQRESFDPLAW